MNIDYYIQLFFKALLFTITIETVVLIVFFFILKRSKLFAGLFSRVVVSGIVASSCTLPFVWFVFPDCIENRTLLLFAAELFAFAAEVPIIKGIIKLTWFEAIVASLAANSVSLISGFFMGIS